VAGGALRIDLSTDQVRRRWRTLFSALKFRVGAPDGLVPSSLRAGGATALFLETKSHEAARLLLRHGVQSHSTERYLQEAVAALAFARVPRAGQELVRLLAKLTPTVLRAHVRSLARRRSLR
jgi:hypothetical protein